MESTVIIILIAVSAIYAAFDVFNKRNVPDLFVYASVVLGLVITLTYNYSVIAYSIGIAAAVSLFGYVLYRKGFLGGGDFLEFVAISLMLPIQPAPLLIKTMYQNIPFILSVLLAAGYAVSIYLPLYYLLKKKPKGPGLDSSHLVSGVLMLLSYTVLIAVMYLLLYIKTTGIILLAGLGISSFATILFENRIYAAMTAKVYPKEMEVGDMIATNLMTKSETDYFSKKSRRFGRLVTKELLSDIRHVNKKIPVYRNSVPFALFIFIGILLSLLFGNLMAVILL